MSEILSAHITHRWAELRRLELYTAKDPVAFLRAISSLASVKECALLSTCNRVEIYVTTSDMLRTRVALGKLLLGSVAGATAQDIRYLSRRGSMRHLARVASGLDSMMIGEDQILSQVKESYETALKEETIGKTLGEVFRKAIGIGKKVRSETGINRGSVSIGSAAVELARGLLGSLKDRTVLVIGAGEVSHLVATSLSRHHLKALFVANKTYEAAVKLAHSLGGAAGHFDKLPEYLRMSDVVICGTSAPHKLLDKTTLSEAFGPNGPEKSLIFIDLGNPRNVADDVRNVPHVTLYDMDNLKSVAKKNAQVRQRKTRRAEKIIEREMALADSRLKEKRGSEATVRILHLHAAQIRDSEFEKALGKLGTLNDNQKEVVRALLLSVTKKLLAPPTATLKQASKIGDKQLLDAAAKLFQLID